MMWSEECTFLQFSIISSIIVFENDGCCDQRGKGSVVAWGVGTHGMGNLHKCEGIDNAEK